MYLMEQQLLWFTVTRPLLIMQEKLQTTDDNGLFYCHILDKGFYKLIHPRNIVNCDNPTMF